MKYSVTIIIIFLFSFCKAQENIASTAISPAIKKIIDSIAKGGMVESETTGMGGTRSAQWQRYDRLSTLASPKELLMLANDKSAIVRCYAFEALVKRQDTLAFSVLLGHLRDTAKIRLMNYDVIYSQSVGDYCLSRSYPMMDYNKHRQIDSVLLYGQNITLSAKDDLLVHLRPTGKSYDRIREIAVKEKSGEACIALARFQKQDDISIINDLFSRESTEYYGIYAAREFPNAAFYPQLLRIFKHEWKQKLYDYPKWRILYQALAKYPNQQTYQLFEITTKSKDNFRYNTLGKYLMIALTKYPSEYFESLKNKIHLEDYYKEEINTEINIEK